MFKKCAYKIIRGDETPLDFLDTCLESGGFIILQLKRVFLKISLPGSNVDATE